ncbi:MAG: TrmH family RNA methyltransferase [Candidatus Peribacteraceae bacterium]
MPQHLSVSPTRRLRLIAHNIRSLWNIGSFFRSADAANIEHVYLTGYTAVPPRYEITKTALGAEEWIPWSQYADVMDAVKHARDSEFSIVSLERTDSSISLYEYEWDDAVCLIVGHEIDGVPKAVQESSDATVHIPMEGKKQSLNVSVAAGIALSAARNVA